MNDIIAIPETVVGETPLTFNALTGQFEDAEGNAVPTEEAGFVTTEGEVATDVTVTTIH